MKSMFFVAAALAAVSVPAAAQVTQGQYGDVQSVAGGYQLTSDTAAGPGYAGIYFGFGPGSLTLSSLTTLSADYTLTDGSFLGGSPRFTLFDNTNNQYNAAYIYFTGTPGTTTGNYADLNDTTVRVECNGFAGCSTIYPGTTFADFVTQAGSTGISLITLDVDGGWADRQQLLVSDFNVNGNHFGAAPAVPEPATWAMMLIGFGGVGFQLRRTRRANGLIAQAA